jgi:PAS domain S-box-containing protein
MPVEPALHGRPAIGDAVLWAILDAAPDGLLIVDEQGLMQLANRRLEELFGYERGELFGRPVEALLPARSRQVHAEHREGFAARPRVRSMGDGGHLVGLRRDGSEFPVDISLSPLDTGSRHWVIAAVRDGSQRRVSEERRRQIALLDEEDRMARELGETVIRGLFGSGLRLQALRGRVPTDLRDDVDAIVGDIDASIREIRQAIFGVTLRNDGV